MENTPNGDRSPTPTWKRVLALVGVVVVVGFVVWIAASMLMVGG